MATKLINRIIENHAYMDSLLGKMLNNIPETMKDMGFFAADRDNVANTKLAKRFTENGTPWTKQS